MNNPELSHMTPLACAELLPGAAVTPASATGVCVWAGEAVGGASSISLWTPADLRLQLDASLS